MSTGGAWVNFNFHARGFTGVQGRSRVYFCAITRHLLVLLYFPNKEIYMKKSFVFWHNRTFWPWLVTIRKRVIHYGEISHFSTNSRKKNWLKLLVLNSCEVNVSRERCFPILSMFQLGKLLKHDTAVTNVQNRLLWEWLLKFYLIICIQSISSKMHIVYDQGSQFGPFGAKFQKFGLIEH